MTRTVLAAGQHVLDEWACLRGVVKYRPIFFSICTKWRIR